MNYATQLSSKRKIISWRSKHISLILFIWILCCLQSISGQQQEQQNYSPLLPVNYPQWYNAQRLGLFPDEVRASNQFSKSRSAPAFNSTEMEKPNGAGPATIKPVTTPQVSVVNTVPLQNNGSLEAQPSAQDLAKYSNLQKLVQQLYMAQAQVQLEAGEIQRAQTIAATEQKSLEETSNNVRVITAALHTAQQAVASAALRAQTAQLQLAAHDQLLFTARQKVDCLSAQMVGLQAEVGITSESKAAVDLPSLMARLKQPLPAEQQPKPVPIYNAAPNENPNLHQVDIHSADYSKYFIQPNTFRLTDSTDFLSNPKTLTKRSHKLKNNWKSDEGDKVSSSKDLKNILEWLHSKQDSDIKRTRYG